MKDTERLEEALRALREADAGRGAPEFLETRLRAVFREKHTRHRRFRWSWLSALAMAAMALFVVWRLSAPTQVQAPPQVATTTPGPVTQPPVKPPEVVASAAARKRVERRRARPAQPRPLDTVTASARGDTFIALPYAPPLLPTERGQVMRVRMPRQTLRQLGLPINEERIFERIPADVLLGEDGIPRAVRIVTPR